MSAAPGPLQAWIGGVGLIAPGLPDWAAAAAVLTGQQVWAPAPSVLPAPEQLRAAERRRASRVVRLTLALGGQAAAQAGVDVARLATVFASSGADGHNCHALCEQLAGDDRQISPTRFHNSVHNAAAGYWGIASGSMAPCQVICAYDGSFGAGLLDALAQVVQDRVPVLLIAYDGEYPEPLHAKRPLPDAAGMAWVLVPAADAASLAKLEVVPSAGAPVTALDDAGLESMRHSFPSLRVLPLLAALANRRPADAVIDYLPGLPLAARLQPCT